MSAKKVGEDDLADFELLLTCAADLSSREHHDSQCAKLMRTTRDRTRLARSLRALAPRREQQRKIRRIHESVSVDIRAARWVSPCREKERQIGSGHEAIAVDIGWTRIAAAARIKFDDRDVRVARARVVEIVPLAR